MKRLMLLALLFCGCRNNAKVSGPIYHDEVFVYRLENQEPPFKED